LEVRAVNTLGLLKFVWSTSPRLLMRLVKNLEEACRSAFVTALVSEGIGQRLLAGPVPLEKLHDDLALDDAREELEAWLDVGVSLGELGKDERGYRLTGLLSRKLSDPANAVWHAFFQVRTDVFVDYVRSTPAKLRRRERFPSDEARGELFAQSSRTVEPLMFDLVDRVVPPGKRRMLEVGCGSGVYLRRACDANPELDAVGLELTEPVAAFARKNVEQWGLGGRVTIETRDVRAFDRPGAFDLVTFYNLVYYFPVEQRVEVLAHLRRQLAPGGRLVLVTLTRGRDPSASTMNLWSSMTEGQGPLPTAGELEAQLRDAGFTTTQRQDVLPGFSAFVAS
jgi:protein-L-isoaspartate O-methyltransferase